MGRTVQKRSVARTTVSAFVMKPKFRHRSQLMGLIPAADDTTQGINVIIRHQLGNGGNKIPSSSGEYRVQVPSLLRASPKPTCTLAPISQSFSGKKPCFHMPLPNLRNVYCSSGYVQEEGEGKAACNFQQFLLRERPPNFLKGAMEEGGEKARGSVPF